MKILSKKSIINICLFFSLIFFIVFTILMKPSSGILNNSAYNIIHFEFSFSFDRYEMIMHAWSTKEINSAIMNTWLDFGWLIGYGGLIIAINVILSKYLKDTKKKIIQFAAISGFLAMVFDILENILLLNLLYETRLVFFTMPFIVSIIAAIKFLLVGYGVIAFFIVFIGQFYKRMRKGGLLHS